MAIAGCRVLTGLQCATLGQVHGASVQWILRRCSTRLQNRISEYFGTSSGAFGLLDVPGIHTTNLFTVWWHRRVLNDQRRNTRTHVTELKLAMCISVERCALFCVSVRLCTISPFESGAEIVVLTSNTCALNTVYTGMH